MVPFVAHFVIALGLLIGTHTDLQRREVPDWLNFALIGSGLGLGLLQTVLTASFLPFLSSILGLILGVIIGYVMYYAGQWGGGDSKMIMGLGALFGLNVFAGVSVTNLPLLIVFLVDVIIVGAVYGLFWAILMGFRNWRQVKQGFADKLREPFMRKIRITIIVSCLSFIVLALIIPNVLFKIIFIVFAFLVFFMFYIWLFIHIIEKHCMVKELPVRKLTEGDWIYEDVWVKQQKYIPFIEHYGLQQEKKLKETMKTDACLSLARQLDNQSWFERRTAKLTEKFSVKQAAFIDKVVQHYGRTTATLTMREASLIKHALSGTETMLRTAEKHLEDQNHPSLLAFLREQHQYAPDELYLAGPKDLGITKEQIAVVQQHLKHIMVKEGVPFVPSFLIAYLVTMAFGNWFMFVI